MKIVHPKGSIARRPGLIGEATGDDRDLGCYTCGGRKTNISSDGGNFDDKIGWNEECVIRVRNLIFGMIARVEVCYIWTNRRICVLPTREVLSGTVRHVIGRTLDFAGATSSSRYS